VSIEVTCPCRPKDDPGRLFADRDITIDCHEHGYTITVLREAKVLQTDRWVLVTFRGSPLIKSPVGRYVCRTRGLAAKRYGADRQYLVAFR
jgi:hypothetical protein